MQSNWMLLLVCVAFVRGELSFLPGEHHEFYFKNNPEAYRAFCSDQQVKSQIENDTQKSESSNLLDTQSSTQINCSKPVEELKCWGYESDAKCLKWSNKYPVQPFCTEKSQYYEDLAKNKAIFYDEADFGYVQRKREELKVYCRPMESQTNDHQSTDQMNGQMTNQMDVQFVSSSLKCTDYLRFCEGQNIYIDFRKLATIQEPMKYRTDVLDDGDVGGWNCELNQKLLNGQAAHKSPLQSWYDELEHFKVINHLPADNSSTGLPMHKKCDLTLNQTTYIMKLDALTNLYHHFCDFVNLYVSLHLANDFSPAKQILIWDTYPYRSNFGFAWKAFTNRPLLSLDQFRGKTVCFKHVVFPLLPRMLYGLYYNMPLISGCHRSGLFHAFNRHFLNGLKILPDYRQLLGLSKQSSTNSTCNELNSKRMPLRITFLSRTTAYRRVLNEDELIGELKNKCSNCKVTKVDFNHRMPFKEQLKITSRSDIFIGIHGAGLTSLLFLPDWAAVFELFNCEDDCYKDLARLRGVQYVTWKVRSKLKYVQNEEHNKRPTSYLKFTDYEFDKHEFMSRLEVAMSAVSKRKAAFLRKLACSADRKKKSKNLKEPKKTTERSTETSTVRASSVNHSTDLPKTEL